MTQVRNWTMTALAAAALVVGILLATGALSFAQEGTPTPTPTPESSDNGTATATPDDSSDSDSGSTDEDADDGGDRGCPGGAGKHLVKEAAVEVLGLDEDALIDALRDGQSLAQIAEGQGMSMEDFRAALLENITATLQAELDQGDITQEEFDEITSDLNENIDDIINAEGGLRFHHRIGEDSEGTTGARFRNPFRAPSGSGA